MTISRFFRRAASLAVVGGLFSVATAAGAFAQGTPEQQSACQGDAFQFCAGVIPNVPEIESCLKSNISQISPACRAEFEPVGKTRLRREHFQ